MDDQQLEAEASILVSGRSECEMDGVLRVFETIGALIEDTEDKCLSISDFNTLQDYVNDICNRYY